jgi:hypothetical protein
MLERTIIVDGFQDLRLTLLAPGFRHQPTELADLCSCCSPTSGLHRSSSSCRHWRACGPQQQVELVVAEYQRRGRSRDG